jgi:4-hydroxybenzoate polyprenyltransferase
MRVPHWIKNLFVAAPLLFSRHWQPSPSWDWALAWCQTGLAFLSFCLISSAIYLVNDVVDRDSDRLHPTKCNRPVASGRLSAGLAIAVAIVLAAAGMAAAGAVGLIEHRQTLMGQGTAVFAGCFGLLNVLYVFVLKRHPIVDVIAISTGFVLRAMGGAAAIGVPSSPWLILCTFTLCLFIALCKRRGELADLGQEQAAATRVANSAYNLAMVEYMLTVSTAMAILSYSLYCVPTLTAGQLGEHGDVVRSAHMIWTVPLVVYGIFRYNMLTSRAGRSDPVDAIVHDKAMWAVLTLYVALSLVILAFGGHESVGGILR